MLKTMIDRFTGKYHVYTNSSRIIRDFIKQKMRPKAWFTNSVVNRKKLYKMIIESHEYNRKIHRICTVGV